ncbi:MAG: mandelate racemase/muconate lactonizing enzyme family protein [Planctomycetaceae bacterium]
MIASRRRFLQYTAGTSAVLAMSGISRLNLKALGSVVNDRHFEVVDVKRTTVRLEFRPTPRRSMDRELPHWRYAELCDVKLKSGITGTGETMLYYTWGVPGDEDVQRVIGKNAVDLMWDDSLGAGLQMAMFDAVGRTADVPVHSLLGHKVHDTTPLSWWNIDTSAEDMASECAEAHRLGYMSYKTKGRPWFDIFRQLELSTKAVPQEFKIDMDFNDTLRTAEQGIPILQKLEKYPQVDIYESPIPQGDVEGNRKIVDATRVNIAMHYGNPKPAVVVQSGCCHGFVVGGGATRTTDAGRFCEQVDMPFWLQLVGAGLTAAFSLQFGGVLKQARWPAVNCHQLYENDLLTEPILLKDGFAAVPDRPGIGYEVNRDVVEKLKINKPSERPDPERMVATTFADGRTLYTANTGKVNFMLTAGNEGRYGYFLDGADSKLVPNDGSERWRSLYQKSREQGPVEE